MATDAPLAPLGAMSTNVGTGYGWGSPDDSQEHIPDLVWPASVATLQRMRTDPVVSSILAAYTGPLLAADWRIDPRGADPENARICADSLGIPLVGEDPKDIGQARRRGVHWVEHVRLAALHLVWGHLPFFPYYEVRDGKAYLAGLPERMPSTIVEFRINNDGSLRSIVQEGTIGNATGPTGGVELPAKDLLLYVHNREGANYAGTSLIRPCYSDWLLKIEGKRANAVGLSRFSAGTPVAEPLPGTNPTPAQIAEAQRMVSSIRVGQTGGAVPVGFKIRIIGIEGSLPDALASLRFYNEEMRAAALVSVLDLGSSANGSRALGDTFADLLKGAIQGVADRMAETATQLCERLTTLNFGKDAIPPAVIAGDVGASKAAIAASIAGLVGAGLITPDASLEAYAREGYHLPPKDVAPVEVPAEPVQVAAAGGADAHTGSEANLVRWFVSGEGAARIRWGSPGDFDRCLSIAGKHMPPSEAAGFCANRHKEATGQWPGKGRVHAAETPQAPPTSPYREPTPQEQAAGVDPQQIDEDHDALVAAGLTLFAAIVAVWGASLAAQITTALGTGSLVALARLALDSSDAAEGLAVLMREAADAGVRHALDEAKRAGIRTPDPSTITIDTAALDDAAEAAAELMGQGMARAAGKEAARVGPGMDPGEAADAVVATVTESQAPIHDAVAAEVTRAMGTGRTAAQEAIQATAGMRLLPFHSAIRDSSSCQPCSAHDGTVYPDLAAAVRDFPTGHYAPCLGRARCRCVIALVPVKS